MKYPNHDFYGICIDIKTLICTLYKVFFTGSALKVPSVEDDTILTKFVCLYLIFSGWKVLVITFIKYMTSYGLLKLCTCRSRDSVRVKICQCDHNPQTNQQTNIPTNQPTHPLPECPGYVLEMLAHLKTTLNNIQCISLWKRGGTISFCQFTSFSI